MSYELWWWLWGGGGGVGDVDKDYDDEYDYDDEEEEEEEDDNDEYSMIMIFRSVSNLLLPPPPPPLTVRPTVLLPHVRRWHGNSSYFASKFGGRRRGFGSSSSRQRSRSGRLLGEIHCWSWWNRCPVPGLIVCAFVCLFVWLYNYWLNFYLFALACAFVCLFMRSFDRFCLFVCLLGWFVCFRLITSLTFIFHFS